MVLFLTHDKVITYLKPLEYEVGCRIAFSSVPLLPQCCHVSVGMSLCRQNNQSLFSAKGVVNSLFIAILICITSSPTNITLNVKVQISQLWNTVFLNRQAHF